MNKSKTNRRDRLIALKKGLEMELAVQRRFLAKEYNQDRVRDIAYIANCIYTLQDIIREENGKIYNFKGEN